LITLEEKIPVEITSHNIFHETWPKFLCCRPICGDYIRSESGKYGEIRTITHMLESGKPKLRIEVIAI